MNSTEIEKAVLSMLFLDGGLLDGELTLDCFSDNANKQVFKAICEYGPDSVFISDKVGSLKDYVFDVSTFAFSTQNFKQYKAELLNLAEIRRIGKVARSIAIMSKECDDLDQLRTKTLDIFSNEVKSIQLKDALQSIVNRVVSGDESLKYSTGYKGLDKIISGFKPGSMSIISARPGVGKTLFALNLAINQIDQQKKILFFTMEMTIEDMAKRVLSAYSGISVNELDGVLPENKMQAFQQAIDRLDGNSKYISFVDTARTIGGIVQKIRSEHIKGNIELVYIDYLGLIEGVGENKNLEISKITRALKLLTLELKIPIILLCQLNRSVENRAGGQPILSDLRDSGSIEQDADIVMMLHRDLDDNIHGNTMTVFVRKNRNGPVAETELRVNPATMDVYEFPTSDATT